VKVTYFYTTRRHVQVSYRNHIHTTACGMQLMAAPNRKEAALFDCLICFELVDIELDS